MSLMLMQNITKRYWDIILVPDTVIDRVNKLGKYQQDILICTDCKGQLIGDGDIGITGVDGSRDQN